MDTLSLPFLVQDSTGENPALKAIPLAAAVVSSAFDTHAMN
jgi:hypothetical protein